MQTLDEHFCITARGSTLGTEVKAGLVNFVANSYQLVLIPQILHNEGKGLEQGQYMFSFAVTVFVSSSLVGLLANLPIPAGVGVGCTTYFAYALVQKESPWGTFGGDGVDPNLMTRQKFGSTVCFFASLCMALLAVTRLSWKIFVWLPDSVKNAMPVGLGLLLALGGFMQMNLVVTDNDLGELQLFSMSDYEKWFQVLVGITATALAAAMQNNGWDRTKALFPMALATLVGWAKSSESRPNFGMLTSMWGDLLGDWFLDFTLLSNWSTFIMPCVSLYLICLFDVGGITLAVSGAANLVDGNGNVPGANGVFLACAIGSALAAAMGCPPVIVLGESFAGVFAGGRTGLTAIVMGVCFLVTLPLAPIFAAIPLFASAPVLVLLGVELLALIKYVDMANITNALPSFCTMALMPYLYSIDRAIIAGLAMWVIVKCLDWLFTKLAWCWDRLAGARSRLQARDQCEALAPSSQGSAGSEPGEGSSLRQRRASSLDAWDRFHARRAGDTPWTFPLAQSQQLPPEAGGASTTQLANSLTGSSPSGASGP